MLRALQDLFQSFSSPVATPAQQEEALRQATAVLLVEVMRADPQVKPGEREAVMAALHQKFGLAAGEVEALVALAETEARKANDFYAFTSTLNERLGHPQKVRIVELMWSVAYADGDLDASENHVISKVAGLLHVTHGEYIAAKLHARQAAGLGAP
jgi:uncharacterized tellurite resistance protein B-like protein